MEYFSEKEQAELNSLRLADPLVEEILRALDRIGASEILARSLKPQDILNFVVRMKLLGRAAAIKETTIAVAVWGEPASFNPLIDNKVRVAVGDLRKKLGQYYNGQGHHDPVAILVPEGGYVPEIIDRRVTVAVETFDNWNGNGDLERLRPFIGEEVAHQLIRVACPLLRVVTGLDAQDHRSRYGLRGTLENRGEIVRLNLSLLDRQAGATILWRAFEAKREDLFKMSRNVAEAVLESLHVDTSDDYNPSVKDAPERFETPHLYQEGRYQLRWRTKTGIRRAMELFEQAIEANPHFARAYAGLAECYLLLSWYEVSTPVREWFQTAKGYAQTAVDLNPELPEGHTALAYAKLLCDFDWAGAEDDFLRALRMDIRYAPAHHWYGNLLVMQGRFDEAETQMQRAVDLDPASAVLRKAYGDPYYYSRRYDKAIASYRAALKKDPTFWMAHFFIGLAQEQLGQWDAAFESFEAANTQAGGSSVVEGAIGHLHAVSGCPAKALSIVAHLSAEPTGSYVAPHTLAVIYAGLGDKDQALEWLNASYENRIELLAWIKVDPRFDVLHDDPRWDLFLRMIDLGISS